MHEGRTYKSLLPIVNDDPTASSSCLGCAFDNRDESRRSTACSEYIRSTTLGYCKDLVWVEDTPEALIQYIALKLEN